MGAWEFVKTVVLKIYIHCDQCQKQVKKVIKKLDGIESITIDPDIGKLTVVGIVPASILIKKLGKAGKFAAPWNSSYNYNTNMNAVSPASYNTPNNYHHKSKDPHHRPHHYSNSKLSKAASDLLLNDSTFFNGVNYNHADMQHLMSINNNSSSSRLSTASTCSSSDFPKMSMSSASSENINPMDNYNSMMFNSLDQLNDHHIHSNRKSKGGKRVSFSMPNGVPLYNQYANYDTFSYTPSISDYYKSSETVEYATQMFSDENAHNCTIM